MKDKKNKLYKVMTLEELGPNIPIMRMNSDGSFVKDTSFSFYEWDMEIEDKISKIQSQSKNVGVMVSKMMNLLLDQYCGQDFQSLSKDERTLTLNQIDFSNMMYLYIYLRYEEMGSDLRMNVTCPSCNKLNQDFIADLKTLEVHVKTEEHQRNLVYELVRPIPLDNGFIVNSISYSPSKWDTMERATSDVAESSGKMKQLLFKSSIESGNAKDAKGEEKKYPVDSIIKKIKKVDIEKISKVITENNAGPLMAMKGDCIYCKSEWYKVLDWGYNYFFDSSSL